MDWTFSDLIGRLVALELCQICTQVCLVPNTSTQQPSSALVNVDSALVMHGYPADYTAGCLIGDLAKKWSLCSLPAPNEPELRVVQIPQRLSAYSSFCGVLERLGRALKRGIAHTRCSHILGSQTKTRATTAAKPQEKQKREGQHKVRDRAGGKSGRAVPRLVVT